MCCTEQVMEEVRGKGGAEEDQDNGEEGDGEKEGEE